VIPWILRFLLTLLAGRLVLIGTQRVRGGQRRPTETQSFHPGQTTNRAKSPQPEPLTPHPIEDADYEELPRSPV
jgi:hypothetical protein